MQLPATLAVPRRRLLLMLLWLLRRCCRDLLQSDTQPSQPRPLIAPVTFKLPRCCQQLAPTLWPCEVPRLCIQMIRIQYLSTRLWRCHGGGLITFCFLPAFLCRCLCCCCCCHCFCSSCCCLVRYVTQLSCSQFWDYTLPVGKVETWNVFQFNMRVFVSSFFVFGHMLRLVQWKDSLFYLLQNDIAFRTLCLGHQAKPPKCLQ